MPFTPGSRQAPAVPPVGPPIIKKKVSTPSRLKLCAIISSPRKDAIQFLLQIWSCPERPQSRNAVKVWNKLNGAFESRLRWYSRVGGKAGRGPGKSTRRSQENRARYHTRRSGMPRGQDLGIDHVRRFASLVGANLIETDAEDPVEAGL